MGYFPIAIGTILLLLLLFSLRIFYKRSRHKLEMEYAEDNAFDTLKESIKHTEKIDEILNKRKDCFIE